MTDEKKKPKFLKTSNIKRSDQSKQSNKNSLENKMIKLRGHLKPIRCSMFDHSFKYFLTVNINFLYIKITI
jgi:hypothetical protein